MGQTLARRLGRDARRNIHRQRRRQAGRRTPGVGHHHQITAGLRRLNIGERQRGIRGAGQVRAVEIPTVSQRCRAARPHGEQNVLTLHHRLALGLVRNSRWHQNRQGRVGAIDRAATIDHLHRINCRISRLHVGHGETVQRRPGNGRAVLEPLIGQRRPAGRRHLKGHTAI